MGSAELLADAFGRVRGDVHAVVDGLDTDQLAARLDPGANSIAWLCWHLTRVQDVHLLGAFGTAPAWPDWAPRFGMAETRGDGYADTPEDVAGVRAPGTVLTGYYDAVHAQTIRLVSQLTDEDLGPSMTLLVSVLADCLQHVGQAAFIRGILLRR